MSSNRSKSVRRALAVGVNSVPLLSKGDVLSYAEKDALDLTSLLQRRCEFEVDVLLGAAATRAQILSRASRWAAGADFFVLAFAGHGYLREGKYYLLPADADKPSSWLDFDALVSEVRESLGGGRVLFLVDACRTRTGKRGVSDERDVTTAMQQAFSNNDGTFDLLFACQRGAPAHEDAALRNGLMTHGLVHILTHWDDRLDGPTWAKQANLFLARQAQESSDQGKALPRQRLQYLWDGAHESGPFLLMDWEQVARREREQFDQLRRIQQEHHGKERADLEADLAASKRQLAELERDCAARVEKLEKNVRRLAEENLRLNATQRSVEAGPGSVLVDASGVGLGWAEFAFVDPLGKKRRLRLARDFVPDDLFRRFWRWTRELLQAPREEGKVIWTIPGWRWLEGRGDAGGSVDGPCWWEALAFCNWLTASEMGLEKLVYTERGCDSEKHGYRLPTIWEWREYFKMVDWGSGVELQFSTCRYGKFRPGDFPKPGDPCAFGKVTDDRLLLRPDANGERLLAKDLGAPPSRRCGIRPVAQMA